MADQNNIPPVSAGMKGPHKGLHRPVEKPRDLRGTLLRLWKLTKGSRKGLGWILILSALASASAILSPLVIGRAVNMVDSDNPVISILMLLAGLYLCDWFVRFHNSFLWLLSERE